MSPTLPTGAPSSSPAPSSNPGATSATVPPRGLPGEVAASHLALWLPDLEKSAGDVLVVTVPAGLAPPVSPTANPANPPRSPAKNTANAILANSPGWKLIGPIATQIRAPLIERPMPGSSGMISSATPMRPAV